MKVFCINCHYFLRPSGSVASIGSHLLKCTKVFIDTPIEPRGELVKCIDKNEGNNCGDFQLRGGSK